MLYARDVYKILEVLESFSDFYRSSSFEIEYRRAGRRPGAGRRIERGRDGGPRARHRDEREYSAEPRCRGQPDPPNT